VSEGSSNEHIANVRSGRLDGAFIVDAGEITDCEVLQLLTEQLYVALPTNIL
jgi:hypothetical protein